MIILVVRCRCLLPVARLLPFAVVRGPWTCFVDRGWQTGHEPRTTDYTATV